MGNSGSTHNLTHLDMGQMPNGPWMDPHGYRENRDPYHQLIKVLPDVSAEARLRATTNGNILHGGGTISGRREPPLGVYRSKSIHQMHRSQTQLNLRESQHVLRRQSSEINFKRSGSEPDLRHRENNSAMLQPPPPPEKSDPKSMSHRAKIMRGKKKKAAPPPPLPQQQQRMPINGPLVTNDYDPSRFGWKQPHAQKPPTPPSKEARKLRLFKTKAESKRVPPSLLPPESPDRLAQAGRNLPPIKNSSPPTNAKPNVKPVKEATTKWQEAKNRFFPLPQFRREKSFDITLLNANQQRTQQRVVDVMLHQPSTPSAMKKHATDDRPIRHSAIESKLKSKKMTHPQQVMDHERRGYGSADEGRSNNGKPDFKKELEKATKRRSANLEPSSKSNRITETPSPAASSLSTHSRPIPRIRTSNELIAKTTDYVDGKSEIVAETKTKSVSSVHSNNSNPKMNKSELEPVKSKPIEEKPKSLSPKVEIRASAEKKDQDPKIVAELTKTFYFGMADGYDEKTIQPHIKDDVAFDQIQVDAIDKFAETLHQNLKQTAKKNYSDSSESVLSSVVFDDEYTIRLNDDLQRYDGNRTSDDDAANIQVNLRPTLPRRQYDIPRFSPSAAWRTLEMSLENIKLDGKSSTNTSLSNLRSDELAQVSSPEQPRRQLEERIQRVYREPVPGFSDNKSGDSGISGDAGLPDRPESSSRPYSQRQLQNADDESRNKVGPFLTPWTPQQDLNDDSSSDGGTADVKDEPSKLSNCGHIFSLSLPRESHFAAYGDGEPMPDTYFPPKHSFNSLQKAKPSLAHVFGIVENDVPFDSKLSVFRSDNWLLSRSAPNSIDNFNMATGKGISDETNSYKQPPRQNTPTDYVTSLQMDIQPSSFNYITSGKHMMYLPKIAINSLNGDSEHSAMNGNDGHLPDHIKKTLERKYSPNVDLSRQSKNDSEHSTDSQNIAVSNCA